MVLPPPPPPPQRFTPSQSRLQPAPEKIADATVRPASNDWRPRPESRPSTEWQEAPRSGPYSLDPRRVEPADAATRPARQDLSVDSLGFVGGTLSALAFSPDESLLVAAGDVIRIWNVRTGELVRVIRAAGKTPGHAGFQDVKFTPDGRQLVAAVKGTQRKLWVLDLGDLSDVAQTLEGHESEVVRLAFSPDARYLATADDAGVISIWNWDTRQIVRRHELPNQRGKVPVVGQLSFDYDGVVVVDDQLRIWRLRVDEPASPSTVDPLIELLSRRGCVLPGADAVAVPLSAAISSKRLQFVIGGSSKRDGEASYY
ncbi:MAG TPA: hypothetical protein PLV92_26975, partial [Pirellulaceae bacterium]|nr:hypothetical protein [Pirellulaceae bacterium]